MSRIAGLVEEIRHLGPVPTEDEDDGLKILAPATERQLVALRKRCKGVLPTDLEETLRIAAGFEHTFLDWRPEPKSMGDRGLQPMLRASDDGNGDGFAVEPCGPLCRVWWVGHDPWFLIYWAPSIEVFLELWLERARSLKGAAPPFDELWNPIHVSAVAGPGGDVDLEKFRERLPRGTLVHDLRGARAGTEIPFARLDLLSRGGSLRRQGLLFGFLPPPRPVAVEPVSTGAYAGEDLSERDRAVLRALPRGSLVVHERDLPPGGHLDLSAHPHQDVAWRPPFHVIYPKKPWWRVW